MHPSGATILNSIQSTTPKKGCNPISSLFHQINYEEKNYQGCPLVVDDGGNLLYPHIFQ